MKILGIQFRSNTNSIAQEQTCIRREMGDALEVDFVSALDTSVPFDNPESLLCGYGGVVLGGSGEYDFDGNREVTDGQRTISFYFLNRLRTFFDYVFLNDIPTLGICYGHQMIGAYAGAIVRADPEQKKSRSHEVAILDAGKDSPIFKDISERFMAHYGHKDVVDRIPKDALLIACGGDACKVSALQYKNNIFTTQFHPELRLADMIERIKHSPGYLPEGVAAEDLFSTSEESNKILRNFGIFVASRS